MSRAVEDFRAEQRRRFAAELAACERCPHLQPGDTCEALVNACGCGRDILIWAWAGQRCPEGRWPAQDDRHRRKR